MVIHTNLCYLIKDGKVLLLPENSNNISEIAIQNQKVKEEENKENEENKNDDLPF